VIFAVMVYSEDYGDIHDELVAYLKTSFSEFNTDTKAIHGF
jgi:hypothetical protein